MNFTTVIRAIDIDTGEVLPDINLDKYHKIEIISRQIQKLNDDKTQITITVGYRRNSADQQKIW